LCVWTPGHSRGRKVRVKGGQGERLMLQDSAAIQVPELDVVIPWEECLG
jgi:hypothetical protein